MLAVGVSARAPTADRPIEVTLSPGLRTPPLPVTPAGVADRWRNIGSCQKPPWQTHYRSRRCYESHARDQKTGIVSPGMEPTVIWPSGFSRLYTILSRNASGGRCTTASTGFG